MEVVALSGGKDSTAMALRLAEIEPSTERIYFITPTGDELPPMAEHWKHLECLLKARLIRVKAPTLRELIDEQNALPNWRMRWCTRMIKIEPCIEWLRKRKDSVLCVGLRADEPMRKGIYSEDVECRYPLREWGWGIQDVLNYLRQRKIKVPARTDCARCFYQRLGEWFRLWRDWPDWYADAERDEEKIGHTYRSPTKDKHPAALKDLRAKFEAGWVPRGGHVQQALFDGEDESCRICRM